MGREDKLDLLLEFERNCFPALKEPVSVENFNGPPKIDSLFGSGKGSVKLIFEHETNKKTKKTYKNRNITNSLQIDDLK
tara:strand:- start:337 stop:573 length:237 start_codon:yes stop_codon:yes gene_type:complete